jgi:hypothetical protein
MFFIDSYVFFSANKACYSDILKVDVFFAV